MAITLLKIGKSEEGYLVNDDGIYHEYICDSTADVANLPINATNEYSKTRAGSTAIVAATGDVYILNASRTWVKLIEGTD